MRKRHCGVGARAKATLQTPESCVLGRPAKKYLVFGHLSFCFLALPPYLSVYIYVLHIFVI